MFSETENEIVYQSVKHKHEKLFLYLQKFPWVAQKLEENSFLFYVGENNVVEFIQLFSAPISRNNKE